MFTTFLLWNPAALVTPRREYSQHDQPVPDYYVEATKQLVAQRFLQWVKGEWGAKTDRHDSREALVKAVITHRFVPISFKSGLMEKR